MSFLEGPACPSPVDSQSQMERPAFILLSSRILACVMRAERYVEQASEDTDRMIAIQREMASFEAQLPLMLPYLLSDGVEELAGHLRQLQNRISSAILQADKTPFPMAPLASYTLSGGRPKLHIDPAFLQHAVNNLNYGPARISPLLPIRASGRTIRRAILDQGLRVASQPSRQFSSLSDAALDHLVRQFLADRPGAGTAYAIGYLRAEGYVVCRRRVRAALRRVQPIAQLLRTRQAPTRRVYSVAGPNALWHMDGNLKMVRYGFVIHAMVDGFSRMIVALQANGNNRSETVLKLFEEVTAGPCGTPSRMRSDRGGENLDVAYEMTARRGANRGSHIFGP
jgi:hypothetical protein